MKRQLVIQHPPKRRTLPREIIKAQERERKAHERKSAGSRERTENNRRSEALEVERRELEYAARGAALVPGAPPAVGSDLDDQLAEHDAFANVMANERELLETSWKESGLDLYKAVEKHGSVVYEAAAKSEQRVSAAVAAFPPIISDWFRDVIDALDDRATDLQLVNEVKRLMPKSRLASEQRAQAKAYLRAANEPNTGPEGTLGFLLFAMLNWARRIPELADYWREHGVEPLPWPVGGPERSPILVDSELWQLMAGEVPQL